MNTNSNDFGLTGFENIGRSEPEGAIPYNSNPWPQPNQDGHNRPAKPRFRLPPEFADFREEELEYVNEMLRDKTYAEVQEIILLSRGVRISINKLFRYRQKVEMAEQLALADDATEGVEKLLRV